MRLAAALLAIAATLPAVCAIPSQYAAMFPPTMFNFSEKEFSKIIFLFFYAFKAF